jgi:predicted nucleotidyltransferase
MIEWLTKYLCQYKQFISKAGVFGSVSRGGGSPNDCDLFVISNGLPNSPSWIKLRKQLAKIKDDFFSQFKIPLNIILLTYSEWEEKRHIFTNCVPIKIAQPAGGPYRENAG